MVIYVVGYPTSSTVRRVVKTTNLHRSDETDNPISTTRKSIKFGDMTACGNVVTMYGKKKNKSDGMTRDM